MRCVWHSRSLWLLAGTLTVAGFWIAYTGKQRYAVINGNSGSTDAPAAGTKGRAAATTSQDEMTARLDAMRNECAHYDVPSLRRVWYSGSNRQDKVRGCSAKLCPLVVNEEHLLLMCFVPKVASTSVKELFLALENKTVDGSNSTAFHWEANEELLRVSAVFYPEYRMRRFYKGLFVRHPFDRLVSAYADKAGLGRTERPYFYDKYFIPTMKKIRGKVPTDAVITFKEFVEYLITTHPLYYDVHWMPYWSRCDVCRTGYDFVGRLETARQDSDLLLRQVGIQDFKMTITNKSNRQRIKKYFGQLNQHQIVELYKTYFLDFKLFGYSVDEFMPEGTNLTAIDESVQLYKLLY